MGVKESRCLGDRIERRDEVEDIANSGSDDGKDDGGHDGSKTAKRTTDSGEGRTYGALHK